MEAAVIELVRRNGFREWYFRTGAKAGTGGLREVIDGAAPQIMEIQTPEAEITKENARRTAQQAFEEALKAQNRRGMLCITTSL